MGMEIMCFDLEGVLVPEIWINVAEQTGIEGLRLTTRDVADYDELMTYRLKLLDEHHLGIADLQRVIAGLRPLPGAREFLDWVRERFQVVILSDTFYDFAAPLMAQLGRPALLCHNLEIEDGRVTGYKIRLEAQKAAAVRAFQGLNFSVFAVGDSYNDTAMLLAADRGFLFNPPPNVVEQFPGLPVVRTYDELRAALVAASSRQIG
ncbi:MAG: bifunctional phosphoserine phosphatase/homoserine phosphotransferase ThrH [Propionibacteriaceae bacterium]|jgi:phosphoserine/homoserine phosphotransferase|nr:bifunctional phosphoserine phosphatase/homoserine phosphotransferase ThrH [Propionibacteriaceae bacterium]